MRRKGNRESSVRRKLKFLRGLHGSFDDMAGQVLGKAWCDRSKRMALEVLEQFAKFLR